MSQQPRNHTDHTPQDQPPFAPKEPIKTTAGERIARYAVWIAFLGASVAGIWLTRS